LPRPITGSFVSCPAQRCHIRTAFQLNCRRHGASIAPRSTPGGNQTFQVSCRQLFSYLWRRPSAGKARGP
jgi:hypothetical protein